MAMQLRRYEAPTIQEAFKRIKAELGDQAVIFSTKTVKKGKDKANSNACWIEVTAAVDRNANCQLQIMPNNSIIYQAARFGMAEDSSADPCKSHPPEIRVPDGVFRGASYMTYLRKLIWAGFSQETAWYLIGEAHAEQAHENGVNSIYDILIKKIGKYLPVNGGLSLNESKRKIVAFIGPTGVGKTTTLAKIAARYVPDRQFRLKIITMDTYRIAAVEQLKIYANIMHLPMAVAATIDELDQELADSDGANLVLIDTAGRSHRDTQKVNELNSWLNMHHEIESHLLVSATSSATIVESIIECFNRGRVNRIIITKIDESITVGHLYNAIMGAGISVSYVTTGQRVPEDLLEGSSQYIADIFMNGFHS